MVNTRLRTGLGDEGGHVVRRKEDEEFAKQAKDFSGKIMSAHEHDRKQNSQRAHISREGPKAIQGENTSADTDE